MGLKQRYIEVETFQFDHDFIDKLADTFSTPESLRVTKKIDTMYKMRLLADSKYTFGGVISRKNSKDKFFSIDVITFEDNEVGLVDVNEIELDNYLELINNGQYFENIEQHFEKPNQQEAEARHI